jgi:hypothetical protein
MKAVKLRLRITIMVGRLQASGADYRPRLAGLRILSQHRANRPVLSDEGHINIYVDESKEGSSELRARYLAGIQRSG